MTILTYHQVMCIHSILNKFNCGTKYVSVVLPVQSGKSFIAIYLVKKLLADEHPKIAMVVDHCILGEQFKRAAYEEGLNDRDVDFLSSREIAECAGKYQYIMIDSQSGYVKTKIFEQIKGSGTKTVSFIDFNNPYIMEKKVDPIINPCVFYVYGTTHFIDVIEGKFAAEYEQPEDMQETVETLVENRKKALEEREVFANRYKCLMEYLDVYQQSAKETAIDIERLKAKLQADEKNKEISELKNKLIEYEKKLKEKDELLEQKDLILEVHKVLLTKFGIDKEIIQKTIDFVQNTRTSLKSDLESCDEDRRELALKGLQDIVVETVLKEIQRNIAFDGYRYYEKYLIDELTEEIWNKIDEKSKHFLVTAKCSFEGMIKHKDKNVFDYSGVCLLVTKALELETAKRFFKKYKEYLERKYSSITEWPDTLRERIRGRYTGRVIKDSEFTLGTVVPLIGIARRRHGNNIQYVLDDETKKNEFVEFVKSELFNITSSQKIEAEIEKDYRFIEKVRIDYRNPAAHRNRLTIVSAKECMDYVIDVQHMLKEMLHTMKF